MKSNVRFKEMPPYKELAKACFLILKGSLITSKPAQFIFNPEWHSLKSEALRWLNIAKSLEYIEDFCDKYMIDRDPSSSPDNRRLIDEIRRDSLQAIANYYGFDINFVATKKEETK